MKKRFTLLIVSLAIIVGVSDHVFGQIGVLKSDYSQNGAAKPGVTPRRTNPPLGIEAEILDTVNVGGEFGAGESVLLNNQHILVYNANAGGTAHKDFGNTVNTLQIGSTLSKNIVMNNYNGGGQASGFLHIYSPEAYWSYEVTDIGTSYTDHTPTPPFGAGNGGWLSTSHTGLVADTESPPGVHKAYEKYFSPWDTDLGRLLGILWGDVTMVPDVSPSYIDEIAHLYLANHIPGTLHHWGVKASRKGGLPYTTTSEWFAPDSIDNAVNLVSEVGLPAIAASVTVAALEKADIPATDKRYVRPTTVALDETNTFSDITFNVLQWWVRAHNLQTFAANAEPGDLPVENGAQWYTTHSYTSAEADNWLVNGCGHFPGGLSLTLYQIGDWVIKPIDAPNLLDAATQLLNGARVCVSGDVKDNTGFIAEAASTDRANGDKHTNALITLPYKDRFTLRTGGEFQSNMFHERDSDLTRASYYEYLQFPDPNDTIYLYPSKSGNIEDFGSQLRSDFPSLSSVPLLSPASPVSYTYQTTSGSVFGVNEAYLHTGLMPHYINTDTADLLLAPTYDFKHDIQGVIEVGKMTAGKEFFHIYSNGMIKNYQGCPLDTNFPVYFGKAGLDSYGNTPTFNISTALPVFIANYGNLAKNPELGELLFHTSSVDSLNIAFPTSGTDYQGTGALHIQALSHVRFNADATAWNATYNGNNIFVLSDGGNISTQKMNILSNNKVIAGSSNLVGEGKITFWAESSPSVAWADQDEDHRFSKGGNIYLNGDVSITRAQPADLTATTQTNFVAENNIRTASFTSINPDDNDKTNFISRKGDIYLGYSAGINVIGWNGTTETTAAANGKTGRTNVFSYTGTGATGNLNILAGFDDRSNFGASGSPSGGANIYTTQIIADMKSESKHDAEFLIPFSNEYVCGATWSPGELFERVRSSDPTKNSMMRYEHSGIIGGLGRCGTDLEYAQYAGLLEGGAGLGGSLNNLQTGGTNSLTPLDTSLIYKANNGHLLVDAGLQGNIIMNTGSSLDFQSNTGNGFFRTRKGDIDMRGPTKVMNLPAGQGLVFLADNGNPNKKLIDDCGCDEQANNVYIQDFDFAEFNSSNKGSIYFGADNNIKLQYGGLRDVGTRQDPFLSEDHGYGGSEFGLCYAKYHCDSDPEENQAQVMLLDFTNKASGGVGIVASDQIDIYKDLIYTGGSTTGMSAVPYPVPTNSTLVNPAPTDGRLHGESVAGYGLYIKTQGNKNNWKDIDYTVCQPRCEFLCGQGPLQSVARLTFHSDVIINAENSKVHVSSPVVDVIGKMELDAKAASQIQIKTDSLILREQFILDGSKSTFDTWSVMPRNMPVIKFGNSRYTPPFSDDCLTCFTHQKGTGSKLRHTAVDTINVQFWNNANLPRLHSLVVDHAVLAFGTDSIDNVTG
ncbi:MAG: hypothetical protein LBE56_05195, partial [Tannerella sp.]|nr:hypothetical protein [Tannerella sp.]